MNSIKNHLKPMNIGDVLDYSIEAFKQNFKGIVLLTLILYVPWLVVYSIASNFFAADQMVGIMGIYKEMLGRNVPDALETYESLFDDTGTQAIVTGLLSLIQLAYSVTIKLVLDAAIMKLIYDYVISGEVEIKTLSDVKPFVKKCFGFMGRLLGNKILYALAVGMTYSILLFAGVLAIVIPVMLLAAMDLPNGSATISVLLVVLLVIIVIAAVLFGIAFVAVKLIFGASAIVIENETLGGAIKRSLYLTKGDFWSTGISCAFAFLIYYMFKGLLVGSAFIFAMVNSTLYAIANTFSQMSAAIFDPFMIVCICILFINAKITKEGFDLEVKMRMMLENENNKDGETANE